MMGNGHGMGWTGWAGWAGMGLLWLLLIGGLVLVVLAVARLASTGRRDQPPAAGPPPTGASPVPGPTSGGGFARAILDERFARGDIDAQEYTERRRLLDEA